MEFLFDKAFQTYLINPLHTNLYRKSLSNKKKKKHIIHTMTTMMISHADTSYHNEKIKSLIYDRFDKVKEQTKLKFSVF